MTKSTAVPTVRIVNDDHPQGFVIINASAFDGEVHVLYSEKPAKRPTLTLKGAQK